MKKRMQNNMGAIVEFNRKMDVSIGTGLALNRDKHSNMGTGLDLNRAIDTDMGKIIELNTVRLNKEAKRRANRNARKNNLMQAVLEGSALTLIFYIAIMALGFDVSEMSQASGGLIWAGLSYGNWAMGLE